MRWQGFPDGHTRDAMWPRTSRRLAARSCPGAENGIPAASRCVTRGHVNTDGGSDFPKIKLRHKFPKSSRKTRAHSNDD